MLNIGNEKNGEKLTVTLEGRLDTTTAPELEESVKANIEGVKELIFEINALEYISSAGLRVLLATQKIMNKQGNMVVRNATEEVKEIFEVTGFYDILNIE
ncbi:MAG: STAS domain-containing protein [Lachnospiraceae bacterium]|nr:STAS domain-containing protein [Lachnospiraceae bacterium]MBQ4241965.1 STAS domain-containing protein [Lachnospiraceae bacterium]